MMQEGSLPIEKLQDILKLFEGIARIIRNNASSLEYVLREKQTERAEEIVARVLGQLKARLMTFHNIVYGTSPNIIQDIINTKAFTELEWGRVVTAIESMAQKMGHIINELRFCLENGLMDFATQNAMMGFYYLKGDVLRLHNLLSGEKVADIYL